MTPTSSAICSFQMDDFTCKAVLYDATGGKVVLTSAQQQECMRRAKKLYEESLAKDRSKYSLQCRLKEVKDSLLPQNSIIKIIKTLSRRESQPLRFVLSRLLNAPPRDLVQQKITSFVPLADLEHLPLIVAFSIIENRWKEDPKFSYFLDLAAIRGKELFDKIKDHPHKEELRIGILLCYLFDLRKEYFYLQNSTDLLWLLLKVFDSEYHLNTEFQALCFEATNGPMTELTPSQLFSSYNLPNGITGRMQSEIPRTSIFSQTPLSVLYQKEIRDLFEKLDPLTYNAIFGKVPPITTEAYSRLCDRILQKNGLSFQTLLETHRTKEKAALALLQDLRIYPLVRDPRKSFSVLKDLSKLREIVIESIKRHSITHYNAIVIAMIAEDLAPYYLHDKELWSTIFFTYPEALDTLDENTLAHLTPIFADKPFTMRVAEAVIQKFPSENLSDFLKKLPSCFEKDRDLAQLIIRNFSTNLTYFPLEKKPILIFKRCFFIEACAACTPHALYSEDSFAPYVVNKGHMFQIFIEHAPIRSLTAFSSHPLFPTPHKDLNQLLQQKITAYESKFKEKIDNELSHLAPLPFEAKYVAWLALVEQDPLLFSYLQITKKKIKERFSFLHFAIHKKLWQTHVVDGMFNFIKLTNNEAITWLYFQLFAEVKIIIVEPPLSDRLHNLIPLYLYSSRVIQSDPNVLEAFIKLISKLPQGVLPDPLKRPEIASVLLESEKLLLLIAEKKGASAIRILDPYFFHKKKCYENENLVRRFLEIDPENIFLLPVHHQKNRVFLAIVAEKTGLPLLLLENLFIGQSEEIKLLPLLLKYLEQTNIIPLVMAVLQSSYYKTLPKEERFQVSQLIFTRFEKERQVIEKLIEEKPEVITMSLSLPSIKSFLIKALKKNPYLLKSLDPLKQRDPEILEIAIKSDPYSIFTLNLSHPLFNINPEMIHSKEPHAAGHVWRELWLCFEEHFSLTPKKQIPPSLLSQKEVALLLLEVMPASILLEYYIEYRLIALLTDPTFAKPFVKKDGLLLTQFFQFIDEGVHEAQLKELYIIALEQNALAALTCPLFARKHPELAALATSRNPDAAPYFSRQSYFNILVLD